MKILELPPNLPPDRLQELLNDRIREINSLLDTFVESPATAEFDAGLHRILNVADPQKDLDAVNLRTLRKGAPAATETPARAAKSGLDAYVIVFDDPGAVFDGEPFPPYTVGARRVGVIEAVSVSADSPPSAGDLKINATVRRPKVHEDDSEPIEEDVLTESLVLPQGHYGPLFSDKIKFTDMLLKGARLKPTIVNGAAAGLVTIEIHVRRRA